MGGKRGRYGAYVDAINAQSAKGMWNQEVYLSEAGSPYHNFFCEPDTEYGAVRFDCN